MQVQTHFMPCSPQLSTIGTCRLISIIPPGFREQTRAGVGVRMGLTLAIPFAIAVDLPCLDKARVWAGQEIMETSAYQADVVLNPGESWIRGSWGWLVSSPSKRSEEI